jgi:hypothetical protein
MAVAAGVLWLGFRFVDRSFHTDTMGTIGRQVRGAWHAGTGAARDEAGAYRDRAKAVSARLPGHGANSAAGDQDSDSGATTRRTPGMEWFKPRSTSAARAQHVPSDTTSTSGDAAAAHSVAKSAATKAALTAVQVVVPEVAVPVAAAAKEPDVAGTAGKVLKAPKSAGGRTPGAAGHAGGSAPSPTPLRQPRPDAAGAASPTREPAQAATMTSRSPGQAFSVQPDPTARPPRKNAAPTGTIDTDARRHHDNAQPRAARPPREIGS